MAKPLDIDRHLLGQAGFGLEDDIYVQAVAGLGQSSFSWSSRAWGQQSCLSWTPHNFLVGCEHLGERPSRGVLLTYCDHWKKGLAEHSQKRVLLTGREFREGLPDLCSVVRVLNHAGVGADSVFVADELDRADLRWEWPMRVAALPKCVEALELEKLRKSWPSSKLVEVHELSREQARCEVLVISGTARDALRQVLELTHSVRSGYLLLLGPVDFQWRDNRRYVDALLSETQAGGISFVSLPGGTRVWQVLNRWVEEISHNVPLDFALARAFPRQSSFHLLDLRIVDQAALTQVAGSIGRRLQQLPHKAPIHLPKDTHIRMGMRKAWRNASSLGADLILHAESISFDRESHGATALSELSVAEREAHRETASTEPARFLQGELYKSAEGSPVRESRGLIVGERYHLDVFIGPPEEGAISADRAFPDAELDWGRKDSYKLQILFAEPNQWVDPFQGTLELPHAGTSTKCRFLFSPTKSGPFAGRITVYYRGRVLQTALLEALVAETANDLGAIESSAPLRFAEEVQLRRSLGTLGDRRRFDACLVLNHTSGGSHAALAAGKDGAYIASLDGVDVQLSAINNLLNQVALNAKTYGSDLYSKANAELLSRLAAEGNVLYRNLVVDYIDNSSAASAIRDSEYLQILSTRPDAIVPLEFVYEYPPPRQNAPVCENAKQALKEGHCPAHCLPKQNPAPHVCPLGFWGLRKVIERHVHDPALPKPAKVEADGSEPISGRDVLRLKGPTLLATSQQVPTASRTQLEKRMKRTWKGGVSAVKKWVDWRKVVKSKKPALLLALPHAAGTGASISLEISGDVLQSIFIDESYVRGDLGEPPPIVLLLGCDVANVAYPEAYARHVAVFRQAKAALVLGTVATVFGRDAAKVAGVLIDRLADTAKKSSDRFGEVLRQTKREAVAASLMTALCLVAFGDADWRLQ